MDAKEVKRRVAAVEASAEIKEVPEKKLKFLGLDIGPLIGVLISIVVGVNLFPSLLNEVDKAAEGL